MACTLGIHYPVYIHFLLFSGVVLLYESTRSQAVFTRKALVLQCVKNSYHQEGVFRSRVVKVRLLCAGPMFHASQWHVKCPIIHLGQVWIVSVKLEQISCGSISHTLSSQKHVNHTSGQFTINLFVNTHPSSLHIRHTHSDSNQAAAERHEAGGAARGAACSLGGSMYCNALASILDFHTFSIFLAGQSSGRTAMRLGDVQQAAACTCFV